MAPDESNPQGDEQLAGDALQERARELDIEGRSAMNADELRDAIAEHDGGGATGPTAPSPGSDPALYDPEKADSVDHDDDANVAEERAPVGANGAGPVEARVDGMTRRSGREVMQGHFCTVDRHADGVEDALKDARADFDRDGYGVYIEPAETDDEGYPTVALVRLRDDTHALIRVPYDALSPAAAGAR